MAIDLTGLSVAELEQLIHDAEAIKRQQHAQLRRSLEAQARAAGFDVYALLGLDATQAGHAVIESIYRNPKNPEQTWAGVGKRPDWLRAAINAGESLASMRVA